MSAKNRSVLSLKPSEDAGDTGLRERLHKVLANAGHGSRRALEKRIEAGDVTINGATAELGSSVGAGDRVALDQRQFVVATDTRDNAEVLLYNKPEGEVTTREDQAGRTTVFDQLPRVTDARWVSVGRLDINTTGLLLLTTDGDLANALMHPSSGIEREYLCRIQGNVAEDTLKTLTEGVTLDDGEARFESLEVVSASNSHSWYRVTLEEGRNREVRRMWESQECRVSRLKRIRYGDIALPRHLRPGQSETLDTASVKQLRQQAGMRAPVPALTLAPIAHQRRARRGVTEYKPQSQDTAHAWTGSRADESREFRKFDRMRDDKPPQKRGSQHRKPPNARGGKGASGPGKPRNPAPGQELPGARTWFAGDDRKGSKGKGGGSRGGGNHRGRH